MRPVSKRSVTIADIATEAGVSRATVSRVLNGTATVSADKVEAVEKAIKRTGYVVSSAARQLATGRSDSLAVVLTEPVDELFSDPTITAVLKGVIDAQTKTNYALTIHPASTDAEIEKTSRQFERGLADAIIDITPYTRDALTQNVIRLNMPMVMCGQPSGEMEPNPLIVYVYSDDVEGGRQIGSHFLSLGREKIAALSGPADNPATEDRLRGIKDRTRRDLVFEAFGKWNQHSGYEMAQQLLQSGVEFDGIVAGNDRIARGAIRCLREAGLSIPEDVAIVGYDNHPLAELNDPPITTIEQDFHAQGTLAVKLAIDMINGGTSHNVVLSPRLIVRESSAGPSV